MVEDAESKPDCVSWFKKGGESHRQISQDYHFMGAGAGVYAQDKMDRLHAHARIPNHLPLKY